MKMTKKKPLICSSLLVSLLYFVFGSPVSNAAVPVSIRSIDNQYQLLRNGEPYHIKGAGGLVHFDRLAEYGGNSIRTWSAENAQAILDEAHKHGLTVTLGLWVGHEYDGFDYNNEELVARQLEQMRQDVIKYKDHPALLMWGVGNEVSLHYATEKVWLAIEEIAKMIAETDGEHPIMTVLAGVRKNEIETIMQKCPHIEVLGINAYAGLQAMPGLLLEAGWDGPFVFTEWGANGYWEVASTEWGAAFEQSSSEKAQTFITRHQTMATEYNGKFLGSYVFFWGHKHEVTPTWFGLFLESGHETGVIDAMHYIWNGYWPDNRAPEIHELVIQNPTHTEGGIRLNANMEYQFNVSLIDAEGDNLSLSWEILSEPHSEDVGLIASSGGVSLIESENESLQFISPNKPGAFRLYVYAFDDQNHAATINVPFLVQ